MEEVVLNHVKNSPYPLHRSDVANSLRHFGKTAVKRTIEELVNLGKLQYTVDVRLKAV